MSNPSVEISGISCVLGGKTVLKGLSLNVAEGEFLSVIGPNGAGKSTLLRCMMKMTRISAGSIRIIGRQISEYSQRDLASRLAYVPQAEGRSFPFTVGEFVMMGRYPHLSPFTSPTIMDEEAVSEAMSMCGIGKLRKRRMGTLSGGERQLALVAAALAQSPDVLLLDEPATFLDPRHSSDIYRVISKINSETGRTVIAVTHDINSTVMLGGMTAVLVDGAIAGHMKSGEVLSSGILEKAFSKEFNYAEHPLTGARIIAPDVIS